MKRSALCLGLWAALTFASPVFAIGSNFSYQGSLQDAGAPANGSYDLEFRLQTQAGVPIGSPVVKDNVAVAQGVFSVELDFGPVISTADYQLQIGVRAGTSSGAFTALAPATRITATPQAQVATIAAEAVTVSPGSVTSAGIADGSVGIADVNTAQVQARVSGVCAANSSINAIASNGTVTCEVDDTGTGGGDITAVNTPAGGGLSGGVAAGDANLAIAVDGVTGAMIANSTIGGADVDLGQIQGRVSGTCVAGSSIRAIASNGLVTCEVDDIGASGWLLAGNTGTNPATNFIGTTDNVAFEVRVNNTRVASFAPSGTANAPNVILGSTDNSITPASSGSVVGGGGFESLVGNDIDGNFSVIAGGVDNLVFASTASILGGLRNRASGRGSTVAGGHLNQALGVYSAVGGGRDNCAGGDYSWAGGQLAKIRLRAGSTSFCAPSSGDADGDEGTFMWADKGAVTNFESTGPDQFLVRAQGGVGINGTPPDPDTEFSVYGVRDDAFGGFVEFRLTPTPALNGNTGEGIEFGVGKGGAGANDASLRIAHRNNNGAYAERMNLDSDGSVVIRSNTIQANTGVTMAANAGAWSSLSDRRLKQGIVPVDARAILDQVVRLPMATWSYIAQGSGVRHIGPMAQDFAASFKVGENDTTISTIDADGVALAAIQGMNAKLESENAALRAEGAAMQAKFNADLAAVLARLAKMEARLAN